MPVHTHVTISIGGEDLLKFSRMVIEQQVNAHHKFSIVHPISFNFLGGALEKAKKYVGAKVLVTIKPSQFSVDSEMQFRGIVSDAKLIRANGSAAGILINGFGATFRMEGLPSIMSFNDKSLGDLANEIIQKYPRDYLEPLVNIKETDVMPYTVQYNESDFQFLARLAQKKGIWFYYNGRQLVFGSPQSKKIKLTYGKGLNSFNVEMRTKPLKFDYHGYDASTGKNEKTSSNDVKAQGNTLSDYLFENSKSVFPITANILYNNPVKEGEMKNHLDKRAQQQTLSQASDLLTISGNSDNPAIRIGDIVEITDPVFSVSSIVGEALPAQHYGSYYVTDIFHVCDESGNYYNDFKGIPVETTHPPYGNVHQTAVAECQSAIVVDNHDPKGLGRIQVQFPWQKINNSKTPWIRLTTPYAGKGKGMHIIPEIKEEVLVDFEGGNPEKPVVIGAMFHGSGKSGHGGAGNFMKGLQSAAGNKLQMNDKDGSTHLADKGTASLHMDGSGNTTQNSNQNHHVNAGATKTINVGKGQATLNMDKDGNIKLHGNTNITLSVGTSSVTLTADTVSIKAENVIIEGTTKVEKKGANISVASTGPLSLIGATAILNSGDTKVH